MLARKVFSTIKKNKTPFRPNLDPSKMLGSIISIKMELEQRDPCALVESSFSFDLDKLYQ